MGTLYKVDGTTGSITTAGAITSTSTTSGFQPPSMTTIQRNAIPAPTDGLIVYDTTLHQLWEYQNGAWAEVGGGTPPGGSDTQVQFNNAGVFGGSVNFTWDGTEMFVGPANTGTERTFIGPTRVVTTSNNPSLPPIFNVNTDNDANVSTQILFSNSTGQVASITREAGTVSAFNISADGSGDTLILTCNAAQFPPGIVTMGISGQTGTMFIPELDTISRDGLTGVTQGSILYNVTTNTIDYNNGVEWTTILGTSTITVTTTFTVATESVVLADATGAAFTVTLPAAASVNNIEYTIKKIDSSAHAVTVSGNGAETIDGTNTKSLSIQYSSITVISTGTQWFITAKV